AVIVGVGAAVAHIAQAVGVVIGLGAVGEQRAVVVEVLGAVVVVVDVAGVANALVERLLAGVVVGLIGVGHAGAVVEQVAHPVVVVVFVAGVAEVVAGWGHHAVGVELVAVGGQ